MKKPDKDFDLKKTTKTNYTYVSYRLPSELNRRFKKFARKEGESASQVIAQIIDWALEGKNMK